MAPAAVATVERRLNQAGRKTQPGCDRLHLCGRLMLRHLQRFVDRGHDEVLEHLGVTGGSRVDCDADHLLRPGHDDAHGATPGAGLDGLGLEPGLNLGIPVLHLLHLPDHLQWILHSETSLTRVTRPSNLRTTSRTNGSSSGLAGVRGPTFIPSPLNSFILKSTVTPFPNQSRTSGNSCADCS